MSIMELYTMSSQELDRKSVLDKVINREISQVTAASILNLTDRHIRLLLKNYKKDGADALISKRRGKTSNRAKPKEFRDNVLNIVTEKYSDFGPTFASEKLLENHNIKIYHGTLRSWMIEDGIFNNKNRKETKIHQSRERREYFGELVQIDGSHHDWFEGRADNCCLLVFIDDATGLMYCRFEESETTFGYFRAVKDYIDNYGKPVAFYSDKHSIFRVNQESTKPAQTQFQRAMSELNIQLICANSPQAKGRVERANKTLQDRLVKELRLKNISSIAEANEYLPEFIQKYNQKFIKEPRSNVDAHREINITNQQLDFILSKRTTRKVSKNLEFNFNNNICQITTKTKGYRLRQSAITISENTNNEIKLSYKNKKYEFKIISKDLKTKVTNNKNINNIFCIKSKKKPYKPPKDSYYRKSMNKFFNKPKVSQLKRISVNNTKPDISK